MAYHTFTATDYRDFSQKLIQMATSKHISAGAVNAAGTGYVTGDVIKVAHAGAALEATFEVTAVAGAVTAVTLRSMGAYSNRVATVAVNAGGSSYPLSATIFLQIQGGTFTEPARVSATTNGSGVVTAVSLVDGGGAYSSAPAGTGAATHRNGPSTNTTGTGCTIDTTMTGLVGTSGVATTAVTGAGTGCTLNLTLTDTGWTAVRTTRGYHQPSAGTYSFNSVNDEREVVLQGTVSGGDVPFVGLRTYSAPDGADTVYGMALTGFDDYNASLVYASQPNPGPNTSPTSSGNGGSHMLLLGSASPAGGSMVSWFSVTGRRLLAVAKCSNGSTISYMSMYLGLMNPYGTQTESPYPMLVAGSSRFHNRSPWIGGESVTGISDALSDATVTAGEVSSSPIWYRSQSDGSYNTLANVGHTSGGAAQFTFERILYPVGRPPDTSASVDQIVVGDTTNATNITMFSEGIVKPSGAADFRLFPTLTGNESLLIPVTAITAPDGGANTIDHTIRGEVDNVFWVSATKSDGTVLTSEDTVTVSSSRYIIFGNAARTQRYDYFAIKEA